MAVCTMCEGPLSHTTHQHLLAQQQHGLLYDHPVFTRDWYLLLQKGKQRAAACCQAS